MIYDPLAYEHNEGRKFYWICSLLYLQYLVECTKETFSENLSTMRIGVMFLFQFSLLFKLFILTMYHFSKKSAKCPSTNNWLKKMWNINIMLCHASAVLSHSVTSDFPQPHGLQPIRHLCPCGFSRQEYWSGFLCPPPGDLPDPGIEPSSPTLQVDSLLTVTREAQEYWSG